MKKITSFLAIVMAFLISFSALQEVDAGSPRIYSNNSGVVYSEMAAIEIPFTNDSGQEATINSVHVQRLGFEGTEVDFEEWETVVIDGNPKELVGTHENDELPNTTVPHGETKVIASVSTGAPWSWRNWYGGGERSEDPENPRDSYVVLKVWINATIGGIEVDIDPFEVYHMILIGECNPGNDGIGGGWAQFIKDNGNGSATFAVKVQEEYRHWDAENCPGLPITGLKVTDFNVYEPSDQGAIDRGRIISVNETEPGVYTVIWRYLVGSHVMQMSVKCPTDGQFLELPGMDAKGNPTGNQFVAFITTEAVPRTFKSITSNLNEILNIENTEKELVFTMAGFGSISFAPGLNLIDHMEELSKLADFLVIKYDEKDNTMRASVDTKSLAFLAGHGAKIQFFDVAKKMDIEGLTEKNFKDYLDIKVYDDGKLVGKISDYFDWDEVTYDAENDILTLPVNHFTEYVLGEKVVEELPETGIAIIGAVSFGIASLGGYAIYTRRKRK
jgi:LPXTG-motif cell wall-anchored protein